MSACLRRLFLFNRTKMACCEALIGARTESNSSNRTESRQLTESCSQPVEYSGKMKRLMAATDYAGPEVVGGTKWSELSINARKKLIKLAKIKELRKTRKALSRQDKDKGREKRKDSSDSLSKYDLKQIQRKRLSEAMQTGLKVAIDCSFEDTLSPKEICKLSGQVGRLYGSNKKSEKPFHLYLVGLNSSGRLVQECRRRHEGFDSYMIEFSEKLAWDVTEKNNIVFLTPDSNNVLQDLDASKMYVLGGLVDESIAKNVTARFAANNALNTARLPIAEYMEREPGSTAHTVLTINQVVDILLCVHCTGDWRGALGANVPLRKGYRVKSVVD